MRGEFAVSYYTLLCVAKYSDFCELVKKPSRLNIEIAKCESAAHFFGCTVILHSLHRHLFLLLNAFFKT
jgi:hypothetical protein